MTATESLIDFISSDVIPYLNLGDFEKEMLQYRLEDIRESVEEEDGNV